MRATATNGHSYRLFNLRDEATGSVISDLQPDWFASQPSALESLVSLASTPRVRKAREAYSFRTGLNS